MHFVETFGGIRAVQAFRREQRNNDIFASFNAQYAAASLRSSRLLAVYSPAITLVGNVATGAVLCYGGLRVLDGDIKVGVLATFLLYLGRFFDPLQDLSQFYNSFQSAAAALEKISGVLDEQPAVPEPAHPVPLPARRGPGRGVRFEAVRFGYRESVVLPGLDLAIPSGQTVALVGATGAGKTTIARLLARVYDPGQGRVLLDGVDLRSLTDQALRREVVLVTQENFLFTGSVADNIAARRPGGEPGRDRGGGPGHRRGQLHPGTPGRVRRRGRQARRPAVCRAAAADLVRPRLPGRPRRPGTGRGHLAAGHPQRADGTGGAAHHPGRADRADHRAPAVHRGDRRPGAGAQRRPDRRGRRRRNGCWPATGPTRRCTRTGGRAWPSAPGR